MGDIWYPEYRDELLGTLYPFTDDSTLVSQDGFTLDSKLFLDAAIYPLVQVSRLSVTALTVSLDGTVVLQIGGGGTAFVLEAVFNVLDLPEVISLVDSSGLPGGVLVPNPSGLVTLQAWPAGTHKFQPGAADFVATVCHAVPPQLVTGISVGGRVFNGDVWIYGYNGIVVTAAGLTNLADYLPANAIVINAVGNPYPKRIQCTTETYTPAVPINELVFIGADRRRVTVPPDHHGNISFIVGSNVAEDTAMRITPGENTVTFEVVGPSLDGPSNRFLIRKPPAKQA